MTVVRDAGISWQLARTWSGTVDRERQLKKQGGASRRCPICRAMVREAAATQAAGTVAAVAA